MPPHSSQDPALCAELDPLRPLFDRAGADDQDRLLDLALAILGHEPDWEEWLVYARAYLPHYRQWDGLLEARPDAPGLGRAQDALVPPVRFAAR